MDNKYILRLIATALLKHRGRLMSIRIDFDSNGTERRDFEIVFNDDTIRNRLIVTVFPEHGAIDARIDQSRDYDREYDIRGNTIRMLPRRIVL